MADAPTFNRTLAALVFPVVALAIDGATLLLFERSIHTPAFLRLLSLGLGLTIAWTGDHRLARARKPAGYWPLVAAGSVLSYGLFVGLTYRLPQLQPLASLLFAWVGSAAFVLYGLSRINRWR